MGDELRCAAARQRRTKGDAALGPVFAFRSVLRGGRWPSRLLCPVDRRRHPWLLMLVFSGGDFELQAAAESALQPLLHALRPRESDVAQGKRDASSFGVHFKHPHLHLLPDLDHFRRIFDITVS